MINEKKIYDNMARLVEIPSVSGTEDEVKAAYKIQEMLYEIPYFKENPENVMMIPIEKDRLNRVVVAAYLECCPQSRKAVILTGHYDVVDVEEYGHLAEEAYNIEEITRRISEMPLDEDSLADLHSGKWIFGRGTADMKFGHGLCLELLRHFSEEKTIDGNLLYVAVCGEETNSEGMLRAVPFFNQFAEEKGITYEALLLTECYMMEDQKNDHNRYIHFGSSGKVMPMFYFAGESTHAGEPFLGIDPNLMAEEVYKRLHMNVEFCQTSAGEVTPPPVCLKNQDLKTIYSVSTPLYAASYYNIVTVDLDPEATMNQLLEIAKQSFASALAFIEEKSAAYEKRFHTAPVRHPITPCVKTFRELYEEVRQQYQGDLDLYMMGQIAAWQLQKLEMQDIAIGMVGRLYEMHPNKGPMIIVSIIPPYYPDVFPDQKEPKVRRLLDSIEDVIAYAKKEYNEPLKRRDYYMGISDLSYTGLDKNKSFDKLFENVVGMNQMYALPQKDLMKFNVPGIVLGGYGKDFHKHTERLELEYNFHVLPYLYDRLIKKILN